MDMPTGTRPGQNTTGGGVDKRTIVKVPIDFWLNRAKEVRLALLDAKGQEIWQQELKGEMGFNTYRWDMVTKRRNSDLPYFTEYESYLKPGSYTMTLKVGKAVLSRPFKVLNSGSER